jgi:hypothetical protein
MLPVKKVAVEAKKSGVAASGDAVTSSTKKVMKFSVSDRQLLYKYSVSVTQNHDLFKNPETNLPDDLPDTGSIFAGTRARGVNPEIRKEIKESGRGFRIRETADTAEGDVLRAGSNFFLESKFLCSSSRHQSDSDSETGKKFGAEVEILKNFFSSSLTLWAAITKRPTNDP